jgi:hypothetical protein
MLFNAIEAEQQYYNHNRENNASECNIFCFFCTFGPCALQLVLAVKQCYILVFFFSFVFELQVVQLTGIGDIEY